MSANGDQYSRRQLLRQTGALGLLAVVEQLLPSYVRASSFPAAQQSGPLPGLSGEVIDLRIGETPFRVGSRAGTARTTNGTLPGPLLRLREGQDVTLNVTNHLRERSSIHWHGVLVPNGTDGVPGVNFAGIPAGDTFVYKFRLRQSGTYWYHSHSPGQLQSGVYAPIIIDPRRPEPAPYDRDYVVMLSDWSFLSEAEMLGRLKKSPGFFNFQQRTMGEFLADMRRYGRAATMDNYLMWARMRMDPTDLADVTGAGYTFLMNGLTAEGNWTGLFSPGERVRLRFINVGAMTFHDVRIPGLPMTVVHADGQDVQPVEIDEFRIGPAETYDVIVTPGDRAYTIFSETLDRSGYVRGTIAPRAEMTAEIPARRPRSLRTMGDMGMSMAMDEPMPGMAIEMDKNAKAGGAPMTMGTPGGEHAGHQMPGMAMPPSKDGAVKHGPDSLGSGNQMIPMSTRPMWSDPGIGLGGEGRRVLVYADLKARETFDPRGPARELEIHLTGHMERFMWSLDGKKFSQAPEPIRFRLGERLRWTFVNDTMMDHTMHLHGMFMQLDNGAGDYLPRKHTVLVKPAERLSVLITPDELGPFAFHCHLDLHMAAGMFRVVLVSDDRMGAQ